MQMNEILSQIIEESPITQTQLAEMLNLKSQSVVAMRAQAKNPTIDKVVELLDLLGYELVVQKKTSGRRAKDQNVIERSEKK